MFRYKLRTLLIVLALGPPVLALAWFNAPIAIFAVAWLLLVASLTAVTLAVLAVAEVVLDSFIAFAARLCSRR